MDEQVKKVQSEQSNPEQVISLAANYWPMAQEAIEKVISEYVYVHTSSPQDTSEKSTNSEKVVLFRFDASACATSVTSSQSSKQVSYLSSISICVVFRTLALRGISRTESTSSYVILSTVVCLHSHFINN